MRKKKDGAEESEEQETTCYLTRMSDRVLDQKCCERHFFCRVNVVDYWIGGVSQLRSCNTFVSSVTR